MNYTLERLPLSKEALNEMLPGLVTSPEGAAVACLLALNILVRNKSEGTESLKLACPDISKSLLVLAVSQLKTKPWLINSYFKGTTPENSYTLPQKLEVEFSSNKYSGNRDQGKTKLFISCSGADSPRPVTLRKNTEGTWSAQEWSTLIVGIRPPKDRSAY